MKKAVILTIDDEPTILEVLADIFDEQYTVLTAFNAENALQILKEQDVSLIICDIVMPGMDGLALCSIIKTSVELSHIPVVLLTGKSDMDDKVAGLENGADVYIEKPFSRHTSAPRCAASCRTGSGLRNILPASRLTA